MQEIYEQKKHAYGIQAYLNDEKYLDQTTCDAEALDNIIKIINNDWSFGNQKVILTCQLRLLYFAIIYAPKDDALNDEERSLYKHHRSFFDSLLENNRDSTSR